MTSPLERRVAVQRAVTELMADVAPLATVPAVRELDELGRLLATLGSRVAEERAERIAELASSTSARRAAEQLGISLAAVSKATARSKVAR